MTKMKIATFVDLVTDSGRRDLTMNSMAYDDKDTFILYDPFGGQDDINAKIFRHTSDAFSEDPVRVLRLARLRARFGSEWTIARETKNLIRMMGKSGVLNELNGERIWKEMSRALMENYPRLFFDTLLECDVLHIIFPEVYRLKTALESLYWHPEGDAYEHTMLVLTQSMLLDFNLDIRYAALTHDFGKGITPRNLLPSHHGHDVKGVKVVEEFSIRNQVPTEIRKNAMKACRYHMYMHKLDTLNPKTIVKMFDAMQVKNNPHSQTVLYCVGLCDERGRLGSENNSFDHIMPLNDFYMAYISVSFADVFPNGETNVNKIVNGLNHARVKAVAVAKNK